MKRISHVHDSSNGMTSWWSDTDIFLCETDEEYQETFNKYKEEFAAHEAKYNELKDKEGFEAWNARFIHNNWSLSAEQKISERPRNRCSDGWHYQEGNYVEGVGFTVYKSYERSSERKTYVKPGALTKAPDIKEEWLG